MEITEHLTCLLRNLYASQEATVRTGHETKDWFQIGRGVHQGCILVTSLFNIYAEHIMRNFGLDEAQAGVKFAGRNINNLICNDTNLVAESKELNSLLKVKEESEKAGLKLNIKNEDHGLWSHHFTADRWGNNGNSDRLYFLGLPNHCRW